MKAIKQIGTICLIISLLISTPLFATDISSSASTADCKYAPLQRYSGTTNLTADWQANTIQLHWYSEDNEIQNVPSTSQSCTYGGSLTPPPVSYVPTRTGYTFKGWRARDLTCGLRHVDTSITGTWYASKGSNGYCYYYNYDTEEEVGDDCSDSHVAGLNNGEWETNFSYGTVKGTSYCSGKSGDNNGYAWSDPSRATTSELTSASGEKKYCWCAATEYTPDGGTQCNIASPSWVFNDDYESASFCANNCALNCADLVGNDEGFRPAVFGVSQ